MDNQFYSGLRGRLGSKIILNDYVVTINEVEHGYDLVVQRSGYPDQIAQLRSLTQEEVEEILTGETSRVKAELARVEAESARVVAETARVTAENTRAEAESSRETVEDKRKQAELTRNAAENERETAETKRVSAEKARVNESSLAISEARAAASAANTAAAFADSATESANRAADAADAAAAKANKSAASIDGLTVSATKLVPGSSPTVTKTEQAGAVHFEYGIPAGDSGVRIQNTEPIDPEVTVWIDPEAEHTINYLSEDDIDAALTCANKVAQAKATGDAIRDVKTEFITLDGRVTVLENEPEVPQKIIDVVAETKRKLDAYIKMGQGIIYDFQTDENEGDKVVPTGAKQASVQMFGGHSEVIDGQIVSADVESITSRGVNLWDEVWEQGTIATATGVNVANANYIRSVNYIPVDSHKLYYRFNPTGTTFYFFEYRKDKSFIQRLSPATQYTPSAETAFIRFINGVSSYGNNICISTSNTGYKPYKPPVIRSIPSAIRNLDGYGWSAGTAKNYIVQDANGKWWYHKQVAKLDINDTGMILTNGTTNVNGMSYVAIDRRRIPYKYNVSSAKFSNAISTIPISLLLFATSTEMEFFVNEDAIYYRYESPVASIDNAKRAFADNNVGLYMELENEIVTDITDLMGDALKEFEVESGGTITFDNDALLPVPNKVEYLIALNEVVS